MCMSIAGIDCDEGRLHEVGILRSKSSIGAVNVEIQPSDVMWPVELDMSPLKRLVPAQESREPS